MTSLLTAVELTPEQALLFRTFMEHYDTIEFMTKSGVWDVRNGSVQLHFDRGGACRTIEKRTIVSSQDLSPV